MSYPGPVRLATKATAKKAKGNANRAVANRAVANEVAAKKAAPCTSELHLDIKAEIARSDAQRAAAEDALNLWPWLKQIAQNALRDALLHCNSLQLGHGDAYTLLRAALTIQGDGLDSWSFSNVAERGDVCQAVIARMPEFMRWLDDANDDLARVIRSCARFDVSSVLVVTGDDETWRLQESPYDLSLSGRGRAP